MNRHLVLRLADKTKRAASIECGPSQASCFAVHYAAGRNYLSQYLEKIRVRHERGPAAVRHCDSNEVNAHRSADTVRLLRLKAHTERSIVYVRVSPCGAP